MRKTACVLPRLKGREFVCVCATTQQRSLDSLIYLTVFKYRVSLFHKCKFFMLLVCHAHSLSNSLCKNVKLVLFFSKESLILIWLDFIKINFTSYFTDWTKISRFKRDHSWEIIAQIAILLGEPYLIVELFVAFA